MAEVNDLQQQNDNDFDLGIYTVMCFMSCCCCGNLLGFLLCLYCRHKIKNAWINGNMAGCDRWIKNFWICLIITAVLSILISAISGVWPGFFVNFSLSR